MGVLGVEGSVVRDVRDSKEELVGTFSFGGGIGGEFLEETAANLKTLREEKREDEEEVDCFCPDP